MAKCKTAAQLLNAEQILSCVYCYFGMSAQQFAAPQPLSSCRCRIHEDARQIACLALQVHCSSENLQIALKQLWPKWGDSHIRMYADKARRKLAEDYVFRLSVESVEQIIVAALIDNCKKPRPYVRLRGWKSADYITNKGEQK